MGFLENIGGLIGNIVENIGSALENIGGLIGDTINQAVVFFQDLNALPADTRLGLGISNTLISAVTIIGLPNLLFTIPFMIKATVDIAVDLVVEGGGNLYGIRSFDGGSYSTPQISFSAANSNHSVEILKQSMALPSQSISSLRDPLTMGLSQNTPLLPINLPQTYTFH